MKRTLEIILRDGSRSRSVLLDSCEGLRVARNVPDPAQDEARVTMARVGLIQADDLEPVGSMSASLLGRRDPPPTLLAPHQIARELDAPPDATVAAAVMEWSAQPRSRPRPLGVVEAADTEPPADTSDVTTLR